MSRQTKILVVDDEDLIRMNLRALLEDLGYLVEEAADGREGLVAFDRVQPDLVLADLMMPVMDGLTLIAGLREKSPETPVIVISGTGAVKEAVDALRLGAWDYVVKPVTDADGLDIAINRALEKARLVRENRLYRERLEELVRERTGELRDSEARYRRLLESVTSYVYTVTFEDGLPGETVHGPGCESLTGFTPGELAADPPLWQRIIHDDDRQLVADTERRIIDEGRSGSLEYRIHHKGGAVRWVRNTMVPHRTAAGELLSYDGVVADITERREAEEKLRASEEMYSSIFTHIGIGVSVISPDMEILYLNPVMKKLNPHIDVGKRPICYRSFNIPPRDEICSYCPTIKTLRDGEVHVSVTETPIAGGMMNLRIISAPLLSPDGSLVAAIEVVEDVTELKQAEEKLRRTNEMLCAVIEAVPTAIIGLDLDGNVQNLWNTAAEKMLGWTAREVMGRPLPSVQTENREEFRKFRELIRSGRNLEGVEVRRQRRDGTPIDYSIYSSPLRDADGRITGNVAVLVDNAEHKRAEERLNEQLHFLQQLLDSIPIPVYYKGLDGYYLGCNSAFETFVGLPRNRIVGKTMYELFPKDLTDIYRDADSALLRSPGVQVYETSVMNKDGTRHDVIFNKAAYVGADGHTIGIVGAIMDITERKKAEEDRKLLEDQLHQAQKMEAIGQLAGGVAHDFNNILTAILGYSEITLMRMAKDSPLRHFVEQIMASADRAAELTNGLLAFSRRQVLHTKPIDLCGVVGGLKKMLGRLLPEDIEFRTKVAERELVVLADKGRIEQVLMNLVTNAKDAMPRGGSLSIDVSPAVMDERFVHAHGLGEPGNYACISVADTGHGMDEETAKRIFEPFFTTKEAGKGTGLGMAIIYGIVQQHNGCITVQSETGRGTTFRIYLPLIAGEVGEAHGSRLAETPPGGTETILLAEDEVTVRVLHKMILEGAGYMVIEAVDGEDALGKFTEHVGEVDIVATDVVMPKIDGKSLYEEIRKIRPDMKVLFMSGYTKDVILERGILDDGFSYVTKPVKSSELLRKVRDILDRNPC